MNTRPYLYFAYGSNLHLEQMANRCPNARPVAPYELDGFKLVFRSVADVTESENDVVHGALYEITVDCEASLDGYEGFPYLYTKQIINDPELGDIMFYIMNDRDSLAPPWQGYFATIYEGFEHWGLDKYYLFDALPENCEELPEKRVRPQKQLTLDLKGERKACPQSKRINTLTWHSKVYGGKRR